MKRVGTLAVLLLAGAGAGWGADIVNGSFESGTNGWAVSSSNTNPPAYTVASDEGLTDGAYALVLGSANAPGNAIFAQTLATVSGAVYAVRFDHGAFGLRSRLQELRIEARDGAAVLASTDVATAGAEDNFNPANVVFYPHTNMFSAISAATQIRFADITSASGSYSCDGVLDDVRVSGAVATPALAPTGGTFVVSVTVALACGTEGAAITYTTDGSDPTTNSPPYTAALTLTSNTTVKAMAWRDGLADSAVATGRFSVTPFPQVAPPTITPNGGAYLDQVSVTLACVTPGANISYTTDGSAPATSSPPYSVAFDLTSNTTVRAIAWMEGMSVSEEVSAGFSIYTPVVAPTITPAGGAITGQVAVTLACATPGTTMRYTSDGTAPGTLAGTYQDYTGPFPMGSGTVKAYSTFNDFTNSAVVSAAYSNTAADAWALIQVPGRVEAEDYRNGGAAVAYHDMDAGNNGHLYRDGDVDLQLCPDAGGGYNIGWTVYDEWLQYDINVAVSNNYDFIFRLASAVPDWKFITANVDGVRAATALFPYSNSYAIYYDTMVPGVPLTAGHHVLQIYFGVPNLNLNYLDIVARTAGVTVPGRIEAEDFKPGGQYVGYFENANHEKANEGGAYRIDEGVDIEPCGDVGGGYDVGNTFLTGEWLAYNMHVASTGRYTFTFRVASAVAGTKSLRAQVEGGPTVPCQFTHADGRQTYHDVAVPNVLLTAGDHPLKIFFESEDINFNYVDISLTEHSGLVFVVR